MTSRGPRGGARDRLGYLRFWLAQHRPLDMLRDLGDGLRPRERLRYLHFWFDQRSPVDAPWADAPAVKRVAFGAGAVGGLLGTLIVGLLLFASSDGTSRGARERASHDLSRPARWCA